MLLTNSWDVRERADVAEHFRLDEEILQSRHAEMAGLWERGGMAMDAYLDFVVFHEPRSFSRDEFVTSMLGQSKLLPDNAMSILKELAGAGQFLVGALNNEARELNEHRLKTFGLRAYFDVALSSCYLGLRKPDLAIYQRVIDIVGRPPERILFVDDRPENVAGARNAGIMALRYTGSEVLRHDLVGLGALEQTAD